MTLYPMLFLTLTKLFTYCLLGTLYEIQVIKRTIKKNQKHWNDLFLVWQSVWGILGNKLLQTGAQRPTNYIANAVHGTEANSVAGRNKTLKYVYFCRCMLILKINLVLTEKYLILFSYFSWWTLFTRWRWWCCKQFRTENVEQILQSIFIEKNI